MAELLSTAHAPNACHHGRLGPALVLIARPCRSNSAHRKKAVVTIAATLFQSWLQSMPQFFHRSIHSKVETPHWLAWSNVPKCKIATLASVSSSIAAEALAATWARLSMKQISWSLLFHFWSPFLCYSGVKTHHGVQYCLFWHGVINSAMA